MLCKERRFVYNGTSEKKGDGRMTTFVLKIIAIVTMFIDHIGYGLFPNCLILRLIGRISFPIFAYLIAEGFVHTKDVKKYLLRLGVFAVLSEIPFDLVSTGKALEFGHQNIFFTLFLGLTAILIVSKTQNIVLKFGAVFVFAIVATLLRTDYQSTGVIMIALFYIFRERKLEKFFAVAVLVLVMSGTVQWFCLLSFIPIALYNGKQGPKMKLFFYLFYPLHLLLIYGIQLLM